MNDHPIRFETNPTHRVMMSDRKNLELCGVKQIESFDANEFLLETSQGWCVISGRELTLDKLDTEKGEVSIRGFVDAMEYLSNKQNKSSESFFKRLFQ